MDRIYRCVVSLREVFGDSGSLQTGLNLLAYTI